MTISKKISLSKLCYTQAVLLFFCSQIHAQTSSSSYSQKSSAFSNGSATTQSTNYKLNATVGQGLVGNTTSTTYKLQAGFVPTIAIDQFPDLKFTASTSNPPSVDRGQEVSVFFTIKNDGSALAQGAVKVKPFLSLDPTFQSTDTELPAEFIVTTDLAAGASFIYGDVAAELNKITVPATTAIGAYYIVLVVDPLNTIIERNEANNASIGMALTITQSGDPNAPTIGTLTLPLIFAAGSNISVQVTDDKSGVKQVLFFHRSITSTEPFMAETLVASGSTYSVAIQADWADGLGMEGYFIAIDNANNSTTDPGPSFYWLKSNAPEEAIPFLPGFNGKTTSYQMFSIPYVLDEKDFNNIFEELGDYNKEVWRLFRYENDETGNYLEYADGFNNVELGKGYWFNTRENKPIQVGTGKVTPASQSTAFTITLNQGWNQIGNPYPFNIDWPTIQAANSSVGLNSLNLFENGGYEKIDVLASWKGAFVYVENGGTVTFPVTSRTTKPGRTNAQELSSNLDEPAWQLPMTLSFHDHYHTSVIGMHPEASASKDKFDDITVPRFIDYLEMQTHHPEYRAPKFSRDVVPTVDQQQWLFSLTSNLPEGSAHLSWNQHELNKSQSQILLIDLTDQTWIDLKLTSRYSFNWKNGRQIKIVYSRDGEINPGITLLGQAYPNSFTNLVTIPVLVEHDSQDIQVEVIDLLGRKVKTLTNRFLNKGPNTFVWDGKDDHGSEVSSGVLIYRMNNSLHSKRMIKQ